MEDNVAFGFETPHEDEYFIKRVVGIPGDRVRYQDKTLYINDKKQHNDDIATSLLHSLIEGYRQIARWCHTRRVVGGA